MSSGSDGLRIDPGDTQTIVIAQMVARGTNNLNSVTKLKELAGLVQIFYEELFPEPIEPLTFPARYKLYQNYPNPFNSSTIIKFELPLNPLFGKGVWGLLTLKIYNVLGQEIATLFNDSPVPGTYEVTWDASSYSSGVYFYKINLGNHSATRKMVLIK